jgi:hypothetical protein
MNIEIMFGDDTDDEMIQVEGAAGNVDDDDYDDYDDYDDTYEYMAELKQMMLSELIYKLTRI